VGLGVSAIGRVGDSYSQNRKDIRAWRRSLQAGALPVWRGIQLNWADRLRRRIIEQIMCHGVLDFEAVGEAYDIEFSEHFAPEIAALELLDRDGLIELHEDGLEVTPGGMLLVRVIAMVFDETLQAAQARPKFSKVI
jgi:oxygen-independent coproporphyrinogen-3 oxidase